MNTFSIHKLSRFSTTCMETHSKASSSEPFCSQEPKDSASNSGVLAPSPTKPSTLRADSPGCQHVKGGTKGLELDLLTARKIATTD